jgi:hypothetical protein
LFLIVPSVANQVSEPSRRIIFEKVARNLAGRDRREEVLVPLFERN